MHTIIQYRPASPGTITQGSHRPISSCKGIPLGRYVRPSCTVLSETTDITSAVRVSQHAAAVVLCFGVLLQYCAAITIVHVVLTVYPGTVLIVETTITAALYILGCKRAPAAYMGGFDGARRS